MSAGTGRGRLLARRRDALPARVGRSQPAMARRLAKVIGAVVFAAGLAMLPAAVVSVVYREWDTAVGIVVAAGLTVTFGIFASRYVGRAGLLTPREGFASVGLSWFALTLFGALPYLLTGSIGNVTDAVFETAAGFTTTGSSVLPDPGLLPHGMLFWRASTQWIGGMGVIVLSVAVLPYLGVGGVQLVRAESPGPEPDRLTPRFADTAKRLWLLYTVFTAAEVVLLVAGDMDLFQAVTHSFTTMSTGGFGTESNSLAGFTPYTQWVVILFMFAAGTSFTLHFRALRAPVEYLRSPEFRLYALLWAGAVFLVAGGLFDTDEIPVTGLQSLEQLVRDAAFTATSIITTTGFATADFGSWASGLQVLVVGLMFLGGMTGSTAGAVKSFRVAVLTKSAAADLRRLIHPRGVILTRIGRQTVPPWIVDSVQSFFLFYMFLFMTGTFLMGVIESRMSVGLDLVTSTSAVASALGNIGPGLGAVGPTDNYFDVPVPGKWLLSGLMITGRLEIFPVLLLFNRSLWRR